LLQIDEAVQALVDKSQCRRTRLLVQAANGFARQQVHLVVELLLWHPGLRIPGKIAACWTAADGKNDTKRTLAEVPAALRAVWTVLFEFAHHFQVAACISGSRICLKFVAAALDENAAVGVVVARRKIGKKMPAVVDVVMSAIECQTARFLHLRSRYIFVPYRNYKLSDSGVTLHSRHHL